jgi:hypothetical protein
LAGVLLLVGPTTAAHASVGDLTCIGASVTLTVNPGLTLQSRTATFSGSGMLGACVSLSHPGITGGSVTLSGTLTANCLTGGSGSGSGVVSYNNAARSTSTFNYTFTATLGIPFPVVSLSAKVTGGTFSGDTVTELPLTASFNPLDCLTPKGVTSVMFGTALVIAA